MVLFCTLTCEKKKSIVKNLFFCLLGCAIFGIPAIILGRQRMPECAKINDAIGFDYTTQLFVLGIGLFVFTLVNTALIMAKTFNNSKIFFQAYHFFVGLAITLNVIWEIIGLILLLTTLRTCQDSPLWVFGKTRLILLCILSILSLSVLWCKQEKKSATSLASQDGNVLLQ